MPFFDPTAAGNPKRTSPPVLPIDYRVVDNKYAVLVGQMDVVFLGVKSFDVAGESAICVSVIRHNDRWQPGTSRARMADSRRFAGKAYERQLNRV